jgi:glutathione S-transferase
LRALDELGAGGAWLAGNELTLADLHAAPMLAYFTRTPESHTLLQSHQRLRSWWERVSARDSVKSVCG